MKKTKSLIGNFRVINESGQMLLFVLVVILLLFIVLFAIITNIRVDIKETQVEREYERGYAVAEEEIFKIISDGYDEWWSACDDDPDCNCNELEDGDQYYELCSRSECEEADEDFRCTLKSCTAEGSDEASIIKECLIHEIREMTINQDETLEVDVNGANGDLTVSWDSAPAMSMMLVCRDAASGSYSSVRASVCRNGSGSCGMSGASGFVSISDARDEGNPNHDAPLDLSNGCSSGSPLLVRLRAIGADAVNVNVSVSGNNLPPQMEELRVQGFPVGMELAEDIPAPEEYTLKMLNKRLPGLFDYVLFVADPNNGIVSKE